MRDGGPIGKMTLGQRFEGGQRGWCLGNTFLGRGNGKYKGPG